VLALAAGFLVLTAGIQSDAPPQYRSYEQMTTALRQLVRAHASLATIQSLGKTREGRDIWVVEIANRSGTPVGDRPGLLVAASFEGDHLVGSEFAVATVEYFLTHYESDAEVRERLDNHVLYVIPRMNPDAAEQMFADVRTGRRTNLTPYDDDNDARTDEDGPEDLNGDGVITIMRARDPLGAYVLHPEDGRLMKKAEPAKGEAGAYQLYWEGVDNDGDGFLNEDWAGGVDLNRNFQHEYPYYAPDAGRHMVSEVESRALMEFMVAHRNVAMVLTFGESDNLVSAPGSDGKLAAPKVVSQYDFADAAIAEARTVGVFAPPRSSFFRFGGFRGGGGPPSGAGDQSASRRPPAQRPATTVDRGDLEYFKTISEKYREMTEVKDVVTTRAPKGAFFEWAYYQFGVPAFSTPGWGPVAKEAPADSAAGADAPRPARAPAGARAGARPGGDGPAADESADLKILRWMDAAEIDGFVAWQPYQHPDLGEVEIGGFKPYALTNPPAAEIPRLGEAHARFAIYLMSLFPAVDIADVTVTDHGGGVFEISAEVSNTGFLPTALAQGVRARAVAPVMVQLGVDPTAIVTGDAKTSFIPTLDGSGARKRYTWLIRGRAGAQVELRVRSQKSGFDSTTITLR
jgi:hypothetical protein